MTETPEATIARLTAELAEARADLTWMQNNRNKWQDCATQRHLKLKAAQALLPRAYEAALADAAGVAFNAIANFPLRTMLTNTDNATVLELRIRAIPVPTDLAARLTQ